MNINTITLNCGERVPILIGESDSQPVLYPFLWMVLARRGKAVTTIDKDLRALRVFYSYCISSTFQLDNHIQEYDFIEILDKYNQFGFWIKNKPKKPNKAAEKLYYLVELRDYLSASTINGYLEIIKNYLSWYIRRYSKFLSENSQPNKSELESELSRIFRTHVLGVKSPDSIDGLDPEQVNQIRQYIHAENPSNPYPPSARLRNSLVFDLFLETGIRRSELLKLQTTDFREVNGRYFVAIIDHSSDKTDTRPYEIGFKTLERTIEISESLFKEIDRYIDFNRRPTNSKGQLIKLSHKYLFVNNRGNPISSKSINLMFAPLKTLIGISNISPHKLRHTFANDFLEFLVDIKKITLNAAIDKLRYLGGWSAISSMPSRYGNKYISKLANRMNSDRVKNAWERLSTR